MDPQDPRLSPSGLHVVSGFSQSIWIDNVDTGIKGQYPQYVRETTLLYLDRDGFVRDLLDGVIGPRLTTIGCNTLAAAGGRWLAGRTAAGDVRLISDDGQNLVNATDASIADDGSSVYLLDPDKLDRRLVLNGQVIRIGPIVYPRLCAQGLVFSEYEGRVPKTWAYVNGSFKKCQSTYGEWEVAPVGVTSPSGLWVISVDKTRTLLRPVDDHTRGYVFPALKTPDCRWVQGQNVFRLVGDLGGVLFDACIDPNSPRVILNIPEAQTVNVAPLNKKAYAGYYKWSPTNSVGNWAHVESVGVAVSAIANGLHIICSTDVALNTSVDWNKVAYIYVKGPEGAGNDIDAVEREIVTARKIMLDSPRPDLRPIAAYFDDKQLPRAPRGADAVILQCYCDPGESIGDLLFRVREQRQKMNVPIIYAAQAYDRNGTETDITKVTRLQSQWPELLREAGIGILWFALERAGGTKDHLLDWQPWHTATVNALLGAPSIVRLPRSSKSSSPSPSPSPSPSEEPMPGQPYNEPYYLSEAAPMQDGDPKGACNQAIADYRVMGREPDHQYPVWMIRTEHDYQNGMTLAASWKKHRNEMRQMLNPAGDKLPLFQ